MVTRLTSKAQTTVPIEVRRQLDLRPGDQLDWVVSDDGTIRVRPVRGRAIDLAGLLADRNPRNTPATLEEMDEAIAEGATESGRP